MKNHSYYLPAILLSLMFVYSCTDNKTASIPSYLNDFQQEYTENPRETNLKWFTDAKFGMFIHYGLYAQLAKGEWVQLRDTIPVAEYAKLKDTFTAKNFDADFITDLALKAGMKYRCHTKWVRGGTGYDDPRENKFWKATVCEPGQEVLIKKQYAGGDFNIKTPISETPFIGTEEELFKYLTAR